MCFCCVTGQYVYFETSFPAQTGDVGRLISPIYPSPPGAICQGSFWYHMLGATIGSLNVTLKLSNGTNIMVWRKAGNQGNAWYQATFPIPNLGTSFQVSCWQIRSKNDCFCSFSYISFNSSPVKRSFILL